VHHLAGPTLPPTPTPGPADDAFKVKGFLEKAVAKRKIWPKKTRTSFPLPEEAQKGRLLTKKLLPI